MGGEKINDCAKKIKREKEKTHTYNEERRNESKRRKQSRASVLWGGAKEKGGTKRQDEKRNKTETVTRMTHTLWGLAFCVLFF